MKKFIAVMALVGMSGMSAFADDNHHDNNDNNDHNDHDKSSPDLPSNSYAMVDVIVQFKLSATWKDVTSLQFLGPVNKHFNAIQGLRMTVPAAFIPALQKMPFVKYITPNRKSTSTVDISSAAVNADNVWSYGYDGAGVGVAIIDSGVAPVGDLAGRIVYNESFVSGQDASDVYGHGTHVAGIVGASGAASKIQGSFRTLKGIAPKANIINLRVLDANGSAQESDVIDAIGRAIELKNTYNIRVINLSLGHPVYESFKLDPLCQAVEAAWKAGIVVVTAAGNAGRDNAYGRNGYGTIISPGNDPYVITVGAMNTHGTISTADDTVATFSSKGPTAIDHIVKPDLLAPGNAVVSLLASPNCTLAATHPTTLIPVSYYASGPGKSNSYFKLSGTSMAAPVVSGSAALLIQRNPSITPDQIKARMMKTAGKTTSKYQHAYAMDGSSFNFRGDTFTVGAGYLDIFATLQNNDPIQYSALSPAVQYNPLTGQVNLVRDLSIIWGDLFGTSIIWGDSLIWGDALIWGDTLALVINGKSLIWGDSLVTSTFIAANSIIWGDTLSTFTPLLASSADDGDQI